MAFCKSCGADIADGDKFCTKCGTAIGQDGEYSADGI